MREICDQWKQKNGEAPGRLLFTERGWNIQMNSNNLGTYHIS